MVTHSHQAFLDTAAQMMAEIVGDRSAAPQAPRPVVQAQLTAPAAPSALTQPAAAPVAAPAPVVAPAPAPAPAVAPAPALAPASVAAAPSISAADVVLAIVSEKTGYPADMLGLSMEMESELGIDSIKQVEILAALQTHFPEAPEVPASELARLRTLQDVVDSIADYASAATTPAATNGSAAPAPAPAPAVSSASAADVVLAIVSEKTGYPADMLGLSMEMESELGIDSIKQVEILAALQTHFPEAPEVPASELARLRTLQDVVDSIAGLGSDDGPEDVAGVDHSAASDSGASGSGSSDSAAPGSPSAGLISTEATFAEVPPSGLTMAGLRDGEVLITREDPAFADDLERVMTSHGIKARAVDDVPAEASAVISLAALGPARTSQDCVDMHVRAFHAARSVAKSNSRSRLLVTVQSTGARFAGSDAPVGVASLVKTAAWEWPNASVRAIDLETLDATRLTQELLAGGSGIEVALRADGTRLVLSDTAVSNTAVADAPSESISVAPDGVVVVTGGARGVTAGSALALAARHGLRLALLGRTPLSAATPDEPSGTTTAEIATALVAAAKARGESITLPQARAAADSLLAQREVRATLAAAEQQGTAARYFPADINNGTALRGVLDEVRQTFGPIVGVVHGAGVLADKRLEDLDDEQFVRVFSTKVVGAEALLDATSSDDLRFISLFSSIAARAGNPGQAAYAAANAVLESIAARESARRGADCVVRAFGWGPWDGGMVDATLKSRFAEAGVGVIGLDDGARFFAEHALTRSGASAIVVAAPAEHRMRAARLEWDVSTETLPVLADHQVRGRVVVPVVIVLDAMLRAVRPLVPTAATVVRDFQVLSGVVFAETEIQSLTIDLEPAGSSYIVSVEDFQGRKRYRAVIDVDAADTSAAGGLVPQISGSAWPMSVDDAYTGPLFHGRSFAAIEGLDVLGSAGCTARLRGRRELGWPDDAWAIDPVIVDGGLQLAILWASAQGLPLVLPQRIGRMVLHRPFGDGGLHCRLAAHPVSDKRVDYDIAFETADGTLVAELAGVEFYVAGSGADSPA